MRHAGLSRKGIAAALAAALAGLCACGRHLGLRSESSPGIETEIAQAERNALESRTLSHLAALELSVEDFIKAEGKIPGALEELVPKYIAEVPTVSMGIRGHRENASVQRYASDVIRGQVIDGTRLKDTGRWGYAHNDRQVILFVDCTHFSSRGKPWYRERGVF